MTLILLIIIVILVIFFIRFTFNKESRNKGEEKIYNIKKERTFWRLVNGYNGMVFDINWILTLYLEPRHLSTYLMGFPDKEDNDVEIKKLISQKKGFENINILNKAIGEKDKAIQELLAQESVTLSKSEIDKAFKVFEEEKMAVPEQYDKFKSFYLRLLPNRGHMKKEHEETFKSLEDEGVFPHGELDRVTSGKYNLSEIWKARTELQEKSIDFEWKSEEEKVDPETMFVVKKSQVEIGEAVARLIYDKTQNENLKKKLEEWEKLHILHWCIVDYSTGWIGTNKLERYMWNTVEVIAD